MKYTGPIQLTISDGSAPSLPFSVDEVEIKYKYYPERKGKSGRALARRPKTLIIIAKAEYPL